MADAREPHVLILGGGFGSLRATRVLASAPVCTTLVDRTNHHLFQPLLYQVAEVIGDRIAGRASKPLRYRDYANPRRSGAWPRSSTCADFVSPARWPG